MTSPPTPTDTHQMPPPPNPEPPAPAPPPQPTAPETHTPAQPEPASGTRSRRFSSDSPYTRIIAGAALVAALFTYINWIDGRFDKIEERFNERFDKIDERFNEQDAKIHEIDLKLTALIAGLNMAEQIQAALDGKLLVPDPATESPPPPN